MPLVIIDHKHEFVLRWEYDQWHKRNLEAVKLLGTTDANQLFHPAARYEYDKKQWKVAGFVREQVLALIKTHKAVYIDAANATPEEIGEVPPLPNLSIVIPWRETVKTRPYQDTGIAGAINFERCMIGDEQGLGKTLQSIGTVLGLNAFPCLVICPASTKYNWQREWEKFSFKKAIVLDSSMSAAARKNWHQYVVSGLADVVIVNYESLDTFCIDYFPNEKSSNGRKKAWGAKDVVLKEAMKMFKAGILDESQRCKDATTQQSRFILRIFVELKYRFLLSGTPVVNKPKDFFPQLAIMGVLHKLFANRLPQTGEAVTSERLKKYFNERYCDGGNGASNLRELNFLLKSKCFFRREKKDVAKDLPEKMRQTILCDITTRKEYNLAKLAFEEYLKEKGFDSAEIALKMGGESIVKMQHLMSISAKGKMNEVKEFVNEVLEGGNKLILFCRLHDIVDTCLELWPHAVTVTGRDETQQRQKNIDRFQNDPKCQLIVCNHKAAGVGITLTASSRVAFIEYPFTYADCVQCEDRAHRIGQKDTVMCTYFLGQDTYDERIWELITEKMEIGNTITGATDMMDNMSTVDKTSTSLQTTLI